MVMTFKIPQSGLRQAIRQSIQSSELRVNGERAWRLVQRGDYSREIESVKKNVGLVAEGVYTLRRLQKLQETTG
jgi:hypothetical protein